MQEMSHCSLIIVPLVGEKVVLAIQTIGLTLLQTKTPTAKETALLTAQGGKRPGPRTFASSTL